jgi:hypothetical protein
MFFDNLGHGFKDFIILILIALSLTLSFFTVQMDGSLKWWHGKFETQQISGLKPDEAEDHKPVKAADTIAWINIGILISVVVLSGFYFLFYKPKKMGYFNKTSSPGTGASTGTGMQMQPLGSAPTFGGRGFGFGRRY